MGAVVEQADGGTLRQAAERREVGEFVAFCRFPSGCFEIDRTARATDREPLPSRRGSLAHGLRVPVETGIRIGFLIAVVGEPEMLGVVAGEGKKDLSPAVAFHGVAAIVEKAVDEGVSGIDGVEEPVLSRVFEYWRNVDEELGKKVEAGVRQGQGN
mgnify:CR=1 FL=1